MGRIIKTYLEALATSKPRRGRKAATDTVEGIESKLASIADKLAENPNALQRLQLVQERLELQAKLEELEESDSMDELEDSFVEVAAEYAGRKGISYKAFREMGVPAEVLKRAGIERR